MIDEKIAFVFSFFRKPKPSCNWCPRLEFGFDGKGNFLGLTRNQLGNMAFKLRDEGYFVFDLFGWIEVSTSTFKYLEKYGEYLKKVEEGKIKQG